MSGSYCHYYSRHAIVVMTVVTTAAMENRMTKHAIFFLIYGCPMSGNVLKKNRILQSDGDNNNDNDTKACAVLPGANERRAKTDDVTRILACLLSLLR